MIRTVLIVDDLAIDREILKRILGDGYEVLQAANGEEALAVLAQHKARISAVLLDVIMPVMDGYEVLAAMKKDEVMSQIPVIVESAFSNDKEQEAVITLGANGFISKPYNAVLVRSIVSNAITLREKASIVNSVRYDKLTGLFGREHFFHVADELIQSHEPGYYILASSDIDNFKLINDRYGTAEGDRILRYYANALKDTFEHVEGICGRIAGDNFIVMYANRPDVINYMTEGHGVRYLPQDVVETVRVSVGRYVINDKSLSASAIYDRSLIAKSSVKGRYDVHIAYFNESMLEELVKKQQISQDMNTAITSRQFEVWFQPQYNHDTGALVGAEALVRWNHPTKGLISPNDFIPVFEQNGFIYELDKYVWETTCRLIAKRIADGKPPVPLSVNISRYDMFKKDIVQVLTSFVDRYGIPVDLLRLEITESAFTKLSEQIISVVEKLIEKGFTVEIDDFGCGYSSLNTLKDVPAQILKLDMRFFENTKNRDRGGNIIESVVRMAKWLGMAVIAEGVETAEQADFLKSIGCVYIQGYFYSKPIPAEDFASVLDNASLERELSHLKTLSTYDNGTFWDPKSLDSLMFNSYVGGAAVIEYRSGRTEVIRVNDRLAQEFGRHTIGGKQIATLHPDDCLDDEYKAVMHATIEEAITSLQEKTCELVVKDLDRIEGEEDTIYLRCALRLLAKTDDRYLMYCVVNDITEMRSAEKREKELSARLRAIMHNVDCAITAAVLENNIFRLLFANDKFFEILGYTREEYREKMGDRITFVHPDDRERVLDAVKEVNNGGKSETVEYRAYRNDGRIIWLKGNVTVTAFYGEDRPIELCIFTDITEEREAKENLRRLNDELLREGQAMTAIMNGIPGGFLRLQLRDGKLFPLYYSEGFRKMMGIDGKFIARLDEQIDKSDFIVGVHPDDLEHVMSAVEKMKKTGSVQNVRYRLQCGDGSYTWVSVFGRMRTSDTGETFINIYFVDATEQEKSEELQASLLDNMPCGAALYEYDGETLTTVHLNKQCMALVGNSVVGKKTSPRDLLYLNDIAIVKQELASAVRQNRDMSADIRIRCADGNYHPFHIVGKIIKLESGLYRLYTTFTPIEDKEMSVQEMLPIALSTVLSSSSDYTFIKDKDLRYVCCSASAAKLLNLASEKDIVGKTDFELFPEAEAKKYVDGDRLMMESGEPIVEIDDYLPTFGGGLRYGKVSKYPLKDSMGNIVGIYGVSWDSTAARERESQLKLLTDSISGGLGRFEVTEKKVKMLYMNEGFYRFSGYTREEYIEKAAADPFFLIFEEDKENAINIVRTLKYTVGETRSVSYRCHTKDGKYRWFSLTGTVSELHGNKAIVNVVRFDITEQKELEANLRLSQEKFSLAVQQAGTSLCQFNIPLRQLEVSPITMEKYNLPKYINDFPDAIARSGRISSDTVDTFTRFYYSIINGEKTGTARYKHKLQNKWLWLDVHFSTLFSERGEPISAVVFFRDVTQETEKELIYKKWQQSLTEKPPESYTLFRCNLSRDTSFDSIEGNLLAIDFDPNVCTFEERVNRYINEDIAEEDRAEFSALTDSDTLLANYYRGKRTAVIEYREMHKGQERWLRMSIELVEYPNSKEVEAYLMFEDIDEEKRKEILTEKRAETDPLTGLYNRKAFADRVERAVNALPCGALLMLDLDDFKSINDTYGHAVGDGTLIGVGDTLRSAPFCGKRILYAVWAATNSPSSSAI